ncbi:hypothetical protein BDV23DRAFT_185628 [Aspergillus alliaceus]|uniref:Uncharacterized protein n=1 Tax=Petromyces alliaceus TaxID=209559 RepID=A0A5N7C357_PETAA|nr:hypothetical protein BDV23DRAFT_185628 [Aspergillus alliaceus]
MVNKQDSQDVRLGSVSRANTWVPSSWGRRYSQRGAALTAKDRRTSSTLSLFILGHSYSSLYWLSHPSLGSQTDHIHPIHRNFWFASGGIVQLFGQRESEAWWLNQEEILTAAASRTSVSDTLAAYSWLWTENDLTIPIKADEYYAVAVKANRNLILAHRESSKLLLFTPDHAFNRVTPISSCPEYSLYTFNDVSNLGTWIERSVSKQF